MVMNQEMNQVLKIIRQRITNLQQIERMLLEEFGATASGNGATSPKPTRIISNKKSSNGHAAPTRKDELVKFLTDKGPKRRSEINAESGIPIGTVANLLNDGDSFVRRADGKWDVGDAAKLPTPAVWNPQTEKGFQ
jgi:hypothetical protein